MWYYDETNDGGDNQSNDNAQQQVRSDKECKNIETAVNNPNYYDDDYAAGKEDDISNDEGRSEKAERPGS